MASATTPSKPSNNKPDKPADAPKGKSSRPARPLPTDRIAPSKQLDILRAFAIASGDEKKLVRNSDVAAVSNFASTTLSQANAFFVDTGLLSRSTDGFLPAEEVFAFAHAYRWMPDRAAHKLAPLLSETWFGESLLPRLQFRDIPETEAIAVLSEEVGVGPQYREQLEYILEYLATSGLVDRRDGMVKAGHADVRTQDTIVEAKPVPSAAPPAKPQPERQPPTTARSANALDISVEVHVTLDDLKGWSADRITSFFAGVAQVLAAKKGVEEAAEAT